jgi:hypothetical protein
VRAAELVVFLFLVAAILWGTLRLVHWSERGKRLRTGRWTPAVHSLQNGGYQVVVECEGEPRQVVRELPAGLDGPEFSEALAEARADADEHAAALNAARSSGFPR